MTENNKIEDCSLSDVISILKIRCKLLQKCQPYDYQERIEFNQVIIKYLMELQNISMNKESKYCFESRPVRVGDLLYIFSDGYGNVNCSVEISDGDSTVTFEDFPELSEEISDYDNCIVTSAHIEDCWLSIHVNGIKYCTESSPITVGDLLNLFSDKGILDFNVELNDFDAIAYFEAPVELSKYISRHFDCVCRSCYWEDGCLCIFVKELYEN